MIGILLLFLITLSGEDTKGGPKTSKLTSKDRFNYIKPLTYCPKKMP